MRQKHDKTSMQLLLYAAALEDYAPFTGSLDFLQDSILIQTLNIPVILDLTIEGNEEFLVSITNVLTSCPFEVENNISKVEIRDSEGKSLCRANSKISTSTTTGISSQLEFVSPEVTVVEREGAVAEVCVRLILLSNTTLQHNVTATVSNFNGASKKNDKSIIALDRSLLSLTALGSDFLGPSSREVSFMEGAESNETACISVVIVDDNDFESNTQVFQRTFLPLLFPLKTPSLELPSPQ